MENGITPSILNNFPLLNSVDYLRESPKVLVLLKKKTGDGNSKKG